MGVPAEHEREPGLDEHALYREFREMTEGQPLVDSLKNAVVIFGVLQTFFFIPADALLFPDHFAFFLTARLLENVLLAFVYFRTADRHPVASSAAVMFSGAALFLAMVHVTGGVESGYYVGLILLVIGMGVLAPISGPQATLITGAIFASYALVPVISHGDDQAIDWTEYLQHIFFLGTACLESILACVHMDRMRFQDFKQKREIERARDELAELDRAKSRFSANVHHELRTPLTLILAPLDALRGEEFGPVSGEVSRVLDTMHANGRRLYKMINNLLDLSKLESDQLEVKRRPTNLARLIGDLVMAASPLADRKRVRLETAGLEAVGEVNLDPDAIEKVFVNLVGNSLKFTEPGDRISVEAERVDDGVRVRVIDTGIGIPADKIDSIFDRFAQVDASATRRHEGTGIGLSLAREMIELHGGTIRAESAGAGQGTTMHVWLPQGEADVLAGEDVLQTDSGGVLGLAHSIAAVEADLLLEAETSLSGDPASGHDARLEAADRSVGRWEDRGGAAPGGSSIRRSQAPEDAAEILVAEDNPDMRSLLVALLGRTYRVRAARNGREALEMLRERRPDLVLSDVMMPEMSGIELCEEIKFDPETRNLPVVLVTSKAEDEMKIEGLELGADDYVTKPFHPRELMARVGSLVRVSQLQRALEERNVQLETTLEDLKQAQVQLVHAERLAAVGELAAGLAHEVNNPVNFALNAARAMESSLEELEALALGEDGEAKEVADALRELSEIVSEGLKRTSVLIADLRDFASPGSGGKARSTVSMERGLRSTLQLLGRSLGDAGIEIEEDIAPGVPFVEGDAGALNQIMLNLLKNAIQAIGDRGHIRVGLHGDGDRVRLTIADDGPGIDEAHRARLFDPFFTTKAPGEGTGLGLSISRQIAREHGGDLEVESTPGEGATFTLSLPAI